MSPPGRAASDAVPLLSKHGATELPLAGPLHLEDLADRLGRTMHTVSTQGRTGREDMELIVIPTTLALSIGVGLAGAYGMLAIVFLLMERSIVRPT